MGEYNCESNLFDLGMAKISKDDKAYKLYN